MTENDTPKEWVTVKVPKETRDKAQEDPRTYEQIMEDGLEEQPKALTLKRMKELLREEYDL